MCSFKHAHICNNINSNMCSKSPLFKEQRNSMTSSKKFTFDFLKIAENVWFLIFYSHDKQCWIANKAQFNTQILGENKTDGCCAQGRNGVRWHPGKETSFEPPCSKLKSFGSKSAVEESTCDIVRSFRRPPKWFCAREIVSPLPPLVMPLTVLKSYIFFPQMKTSRKIYICLYWFLYPPDNLLLCKAMVDRYQLFLTFMLCYWLQT